MKFYWDDLSYELKELIVQSNESVNRTAWPHVDEWLLIELLEKPTPYMMQGDTSPMRPSTIHFHRERIVGDHMGRFVFMFLEKKQ